ncbi:SRPBCC domain-containing protein [Geodermatophilus sp. YIM 151500]|uniref:SRPBCC family protein n=1 Tax=Geodermatophilus sp. YIM 151500 TaxID=2984531 RepID=UPI0021E42004|nr:SRPBCC domain-containing protein [Geodermatophilus sp. YIM 151500]MCV2490117.1 SRPBCC domain-containing protein [Geodermatophilus sp. YIM 151500]
MTWRSVVQLENSFTVPVPVDDAWRVLLDIERIAPCMPGAALDSVEGDSFTGRVKVKLGPINLTYQGRASFIEKDEAAHRAVIDAKGKDQRGNGTAAATITANLAAEGSVTRVDVLTDLSITGRPAQFGRGVMTDVGNKLLGQFADKLAAQLAAAQDVAVDRVAAGEQQEPTVATKAAAAAATATGAAEEVAASAEQVGGDGVAAKAARKAGTAAKKAAAAATDTVSTTQKVDTGTKPTEAAPTKAAPAEAAPAEAAPDTAPAAAGTAPAAATGPTVAETAPGAAGTPSARPARPGGGPSGPTAPPTRPATGAPARSTPSGPTRPQPAAEPEPIDLLEVAGGAALTRMAVPAAGIVAAVLLVLLVLRRRRRRR